MTQSDANDPTARNPESQGSGSRGSREQSGPGSGSKAAADLPAAKHNPLSDVVLYDDSIHAAGAAPPASPKSGSSTAPAKPTSASSSPSASSGQAGQANPSTSSGATSRSATPVPIVWRVWPVIDSVWELLGLSAVLVVVPLLTWSLTGRTALTVLCTAAVGAVVWRNFFPTVCEVNALGVTQRLFGRTKRIPWLSIDRYVVGRKGVFLTSAGAPLELFRGLYLPWGSHREQILTSLRYYLPHADDAG